MNKSYIATYRFWDTKKRLLHFYISTELARCLKYEGLQIFICFCIKSIGEIWASVQYVKGTLLQMTLMLKIAKFSKVKNSWKMYTTTTPISQTLFNFPDCESFSTEQTICYSKRDVQYKYILLLLDDILRLIRRTISEVSIEFYVGVIIIVVLVFDKVLTMITAFNIYNRANIFMYDYKSLVIFSILN